jgi:hypothetical protein
MTTLTNFATLESSQLCYVKTSPSLPLHASKPLSQLMDSRFRRVMFFVITTFILLILQRLEFRVRRLNLKEARDI